MGKNSPQFEIFNTLEMTVHDCAKVLIKIPE